MSERRVRITVDAQKARAEIKALEGQLDKVERDAAKIAVKLDVDSSEVQTIDDQLRRAASDVPVGLDVDSSALTTLKTKIEGAAAEVPVTVEDPDVSGVRTSIESKLDGLEAKVGDIEVSDVNGARNEIESKLDSLEAKVTDVDVSGTTGARTEIESKLDSLKAKVADVEVDSGAAAEAGQTIVAGVSDGMASNDIGSTLQGILEGAAVLGPAAAAAAVIGTAITAGISLAIQADSSSLIRAIEFGLSDADLTAVGEAAGQTYSAGLGSSLGEVKDHAALIVSTFDGISPKVLKAAEATSEVWNLEMEDLVLTSESLIGSGLVGSFEDAVELIAVAGRDLGPSFKDGLDVISEYANDFKEMGINGPTAIGLIDTALKDKLFATIDGAGEIVKDLGTRLALGEIDDQLQDIGISGKEMQDLLADGRGAEAMSKIAEALLDVEDGAERNRLAMEIFGTAMEDASSPEAVLDWLANAEAIDEVGTAATDAATKLENDLGRRISSIPRKLQVAALDAVARFRENFGPGILAAAETALAGLGVVWGGLVALFAPVVTDLRDTLVNDLGPVFSDFGEAVGLALSTISDSEEFAEFSTLMTGTVLPAVVAVTTFILTQAIPAWLQLSLVIATKLLPILTPVVVFLLGSLVPAIQTTVTVISLLVGAFRIVSDFITGTFIPTFVLLHSSVGEILSGIGALVGSALIPIVAVILTVVNAITDIWQTGWAALHPIVINAIGLIASAVSTGFAAVSAAVSAVMAAVTLVFSTAWNALVTVVGPVIGLIVSAVQVGFAAISTAVSVAMSAVQLVVSTAWNAILTVVTTIIGLIVIAVQTGWAGLSAVVSAVMAAIQLVVTTAWTAILTAVTVTLGLILAAVQIGWAAIQAAISVAMAAIGLVISTAWAAILTAVSVTMGLILAAVQVGWAAIQAAISVAMAAISLIVSTGWNAIKAAISTILAAILGVVQTSWNAIKSAISTAMAAIATLISTTWNAIKGTISTILAAILGVVRAGFNSIRSAIATAMSQINGVVSSGWNTVKSTISTLAGQIKDAILKPFQDARSQIGGIVSGIGAAISGPFGAIKSTIDGVRDAVDALKSALSSIKVPSISLPSIPSISLPSIPSISLPLAWGGIVDSPTLAMIGEAGGREVVVPEYAPLDRIYELLGGTNILDRMRADMAAESGLGGGGTTPIPYPAAQAAASPGVVQHMTFAIPDRGGSPQDRKLTMREIAAKVRNETKAALV